jgi:hypothetical protein
MVYIPLVCLKEHQPYKIASFSEKDGNIKLSLRVHGDLREIKTLLLPRCYHSDFRKVWQLNQEWNGEASTMKLKYYGWSQSLDGGRPVIRISGKRLIAFLM